MTTFKSIAREGDALRCASATVTLPEPVPPPTGQVTVMMSTVTAQVLLRILGRTNGSLTGGVHSALLNSLSDAGFVPYALNGANLNGPMDCIDVTDLERSLGVKA